MFRSARSNAEDDRCALGTQTFEGFGDRLAARRGDQNHLRATEFLQSGAGVGCGAVDEMMGAELLRQLGFVGAARNRRDLEAHVTRILHRQVTKPADAEYRQARTLPTPYGQGPGDSDDPRDCVSDRARALNDGVMCYLRKPVEEERLTRYVREALRSADSPEEEP